MTPTNKVITLPQAAKLCNISRSTMGYWIREGHLRAERRGKNYGIPIQELMVLLKAKGLPIPKELSKEFPGGPVFRPLRECWRYWTTSSHAHNCDACIVKQNQLPVCFAARDKQFFELPGNMPQMCLLR